MAPSPGGTSISDQATKEILAMSLPDHEVSVLYELKWPLGNKPVLYILGGVGALLLAVVGFGVQLLTPPERSLGFPLRIAAVVMPSVLGFFALSYGASLLRRVSSVEVS